MSIKLCFFLILCTILYTSVPIQAGALRKDSTNFSTAKSFDKTLADAQTTESVLVESTTNQDIVSDTTSSREEGATTKIAAASLDPAPGTLEGIAITLETIEDKATKSQNYVEDKTLPTGGQKSSDVEMKEDATPENVNETALSRDEAASIKVCAHESDDLAKEVPQSSVESIQGPQHSSKLLLLSTPRLAREQEETIAEPEDVDISTAVSTDETTELSIDAEAETSRPNAQEEMKPGLFTRVHDAIFGKKTADEVTEAAKEDEKKTSEGDGKEKQPKQHDDETKKQDDTASAAVVEETPPAPNNNAGSAVLLETEPEYVIFDSDAAHYEHLGSFTHIDSDEHLQPIVHSVEEVPSHFEEPLLYANSYVHSW
ncbi:serrate RNA effector molecule homolog [Eurosta solidaginis]|uniref:serrate RNA effector molecule homolog n=1 Tax=Eurosta solidaginis TaxID=178769 RepID=UPI003530D621